MKPTLLDFNKLESSVIQGDYQGFKSHGYDCKPMEAFQNGQRNRKALFKDLRKVLDCKEE